MTIRKGSNIIAGNPSLSSVVTLDTPQTITSSKTFTGTTMVPTATAGTNDGKAASTEFVNTAINSSPIILPGMVIVWAGTTVPEGYLLCDGSAVSRTTYSALFSAIGTTYGPGDSSSTFNLPNCADHIPWQSPTENIGFTLNGLVPNITGRTSQVITSTVTSESTGVFYDGGPSPYNKWAQSNTTGYAGVYWGFDASRCSSVYINNYSKVVPSLVVMRYYIKY